MKNLTKNDLTFTIINGNEVSVTNCNPEAIDVIIPDEIVYNKQKYTISSIGEGAFYDCTSLAGVTCKATTPPTLGENAFFNISPTAELLVHSGYMDVYVNSEWFAYFAGIGEQDLW